MPALASAQDASETRTRERVGTHLRAFRTGDRAMTKLLRWYLRLVAGLTIISCLGQLGLPAELGAASAWGVASGWQREIAFWDLAMYIARSQKEIGRAHV